MKKALVSISFDDGRGDNYKIIRRMVQKGIPATLNVATGYVDGTCSPELRPTDKSAMTVEQIKKLSDSSLVEIALHGDKHQNTEEDVEAGKRKLEEWIGCPEDGKWGFASPGCCLSGRDFVEADSDFFKYDILYMRTGLRISNYYPLRVLSRKMGRVIHLPVLYKIAYRDTIMKDCKDRVIYSVPVLNDISFSQVQGIVEMAIRQKSALTLMFHSIVPDTEKTDNWSWDSEKFKRLCSYLLKMSESNKVDLVTTRELYNKIKAQ